MNLLVISDAHHLLRGGIKVAYAPYVKEMDLWMKNASQTTIMAPAVYDKPLLTQAFKNQVFNHVAVRRLEFHKLGTALKSLISIPYQFIQLCLLMSRADHIHLRCPGNLALLACIAQFFFPSKVKTAKYAGNWDPQAKQPLSYKWQRRLLSNTFFTKNIKVLVYGDWSLPSSNIKPFFTATYKEADRKSHDKNINQPLEFVFVGTLTENKNPQVVLQLLEGLHQQNIPATATYYGDGNLMDSLKKRAQNLQKRYPEFTKPMATFYGNQLGEVVKKAYERAHFVVLASQSEGWPKVIAEGMWHGCVPIATAVSCVPWMLNGVLREKKETAFAKAETSRGLLHQSVAQTVSVIQELLQHPEHYREMSKNAMFWSQQFTMDRFDKEIGKLMKPKK